jgi:ornithine cyclodeaminase/alanine dehydrogenase-like protein (mu-crystallin family)
MIDADELGRLLPMDAAVDALEAVFAGAELPPVPLRTHVETEAGTLVSMPAAGPQGAGVKLVTVTPDNPARGLPLIHGLYVLFSPDSQEPEAVIDGAALTALRTGAVSALATRFLARDDARHLVIFGAGAQGRAHLEAMRAVRPIDQVRVVSRGADRAVALAEEAERLGLHASVEVPEAVQRADIVCTCTTSPTPVFDGDLLSPGTHVNAVGAFTTDTRELDDEAIRRSRVVVETREVAMAEAGDVVIPIRAGVVGEGHIAAELADVVRGARVRLGREDVTVFKSVGMGIEDLVVARAAVDRAGS